MNAERDRVDYSPDALERRLREVGELFLLGRLLQEARCVGLVETGDPAVSARKGNEGHTPGTRRTRGRTAQAER
jgi:hypothetical protein